MKERGSVESVGGGGYAHGSAAFPPVVRLAEDAGDAAGLVAGVELDELFGDLFGDIFD